MNVGLFMDTLGSRKGEKIKQIMLLIYRFLNSSSILEKKKKILLVHVALMILEVFTQILCQNRERGKTHLQVCQSILNFCVLFFHLNFASSCYFSLYYWSLCLIYVPHRCNPFIFLLIYLLKKYFLHC